MFRSSPVSGPVFAALSRSVSRPELPPSSSEVITDRSFVEPCANCLTVLRVPGPLHARHYDGNLQDPGADLPDARVLPLRALPRRRQARRPADDAVGNDGGNVLPLHVPRQAAHNPRAPPPSRHH
eukprot:424785-Rhodomonas_salina.1